MEKSKIELRKWAKDTRKELDIESLSRLFIEEIKKNDIFKNSQNIMLFYPLKYEINLLDLISNEKKFFLPRTNRLNIDVCPYRKGDKLDIGGFGVKEPLTHPVSAKILDLIIVPALVVDKQNYRLGYGKGRNLLLKICLLKNMIKRLILLLYNDLLKSNKKHKKKVDINFFFIYNFCTK